jgi:hypothetical protein
MSRELRKRIKLLAVELGISVSRLVTMAVEEFLERKEVK